jgi:hypothetical protein
MKHYVSNKLGELGKAVHADDPEAAAAQSKLKGDLEVRWNVKFGAPGQPSEKQSGPWWFANSTTIRSGKPAPAPAPKPAPVPKQEPKSAPKSNKSVKPDDKT